MWPIIATIGSIKIYAYPLMMGLAWGVSYNLLQYITRKTNGNLEGFSFYYWGVFIFSWIGAKVLFLITSPSNLFTPYLKSSNFWFGGGFVFYGGLLGGILFALVYVKIMGDKYPFEKAALAFVVLPFAHAIGRIGCFLAGCCYGKETAFFSFVHVHSLNRHPVQLYEACLLFVLGIYLWRYTFKSGSALNIAIRYVLFYALIRFFLEFIRGDDIRGIWQYGLSTSQIVALLMVFVLLSIVLVKQCRRVKDSHD